MAASENNEKSSVQNILHDSLSTVGDFSQNSSMMMRREGSSLSVASLPASIMTQKPFLKSKIPTPTRNLSSNLSGRSTPIHGSRSDLLKLRNLSSPPPIPPKPKITTSNRSNSSSFLKVPLRREISSPPSLNDRRGSVDSTRGRLTPTGPWGPGDRSRIPQWKGSTEKVNVKGAIRKWDSSASLEVRRRQKFRVGDISTLFSREMPSRR